MADNSRTLVYWNFFDIHDIPLELCRYKNLEKLYLKDNYIFFIPKWLCNLKALKFINLSRNVIRSLPDEIYMLENLEFLDMSRNALEVLPETIGQLTKLVFLNVNSNHLQNLPDSIGKLKQLTFLDVSSNFISRLPVQLTECIHLRTLNVTHNRGMSYIPERVASMPSLQTLLAEHCDLIYLPAGLSKFINSLRIFQNATINHIPMIYEKFYEYYNDTNIISSDPPLNNKNLFWVLEKETYNKLLLPIGTQKIFPVNSKNNQVPLYDHCLKSLERLKRAIPIYRDETIHNLLPEKYMINNVKMGPIARCTLSSCSNPIFTTYYFMVVKRLNGNSRRLFTCFFCTAFCANQWFALNSLKYYTIDWEIFEEPKEDFKDSEFDEMMPKPMNDK